MRRAFQSISLAKRASLSALSIFAVMLCATCFAVESRAYKHGVIVPFDGEIGPGLVQFVFRKLDAAKEDGADLIVLEINSPGGGLMESLEIAWRLQKIDWAHTVAYIPDSAISGAAIASLGCDEIVMGPHARWGDAGVIVLGEESLFRLAPAKIVSYATGELRPWPRRREGRQRWPKLLSTRI